MPKAARLPRVEPIEDARPLATPFDAFGTAPPPEPPAHREAPSEPPRAASEPLPSLPTFEGIDSIPLLEGDDADFPPLVLGMSGDDALEAGRSAPAASPASANASSRGAAPTSANASSRGAAAQTQTPRFPSIRGWHSEPPGPGSR